MPFDCIKVPGLQSPKPHLAERNSSLSPVCDNPITDIIRLADVLDASVFIFQKVDPANAFQTNGITPWLQIAGASVRAFQSIAHSSRMACAAFRFNIYFKSDFRA
jgi:hypothetical protein